MVLQKILKSMYVQTFEICSKKYITYNRKGRPEVYLYFHAVCQIDQQILTPLTVFDVMNGLHDNTAYLICAQSEPALAAATSSYLKINIDTDSLRNRQISSLNPNSKIHVLLLSKMESFMLLKWTLKYSLSYLI